MSRKFSPQTSAGIIAEYNPFHNGHALHIRRTRQVLGADVPITVVLSSCFTQRGESAAADKWARARMALANGADLILELPFAFACNAAPEFARGAVDILAATGFVSHLSFGMEDPFAPENPDAEIRTILAILVQEPPSFKLNLEKNLAAGQSWPKAVAGALDRELPGSGDFISRPNNSLALAYLIHNEKKGYRLRPVPVRREGAGYHDRNREGDLVSATAVRDALRNGPESDAWLCRVMPPSSLSVLEQEKARGRLCLDTDMLWNLMRGLLSRSAPEELRNCAGMDEGLENLFLKHYSRAESWEDFIGRCVCARYTRSRLQRQAVRLLAGLDRWTALALSRRSPYCIRVLGYNARGRNLLRVGRSSASLPLITRLSAVKDPVARAGAALEFRASRLRELLLSAPDMRYEEKQRPVEV